MNKYSQKCSISSTDSWQTLTSIYQEMVLPFQIKEAKDLQNAANEGLSIFEHKANKKIRENIGDLANLISPLIDIVWDN